MCGSTATAARGAEERWAGSGITPAVEAALKEGWRWLAAPRKPMGDNRDNGHPVAALPAGAPVAHGPGPIPVRVRVVTSTRRAALMGLLLVLGLIVVLSWLGSSIVGRNALGNSVDHRLDLALDAATAAPATTDVDDVQRAGRVVVRDGGIATGDGEVVEAPGSPVTGAVLDAAQRGSTVQRDGHLGDRAVTVRAVPLEPDGDETTVLVGVITRDTGALGHLLLTLALAHLAALVVVSVLAYLLARRSSRVVEELFLQEDRLMRAVAHEIRNPLGRLLAAVDEGLGGVVPADGALREVSEHGDALNDLIDDLLHAARVMSGAEPMPQVVVRLDEVVATLPSTCELGESTLVLETRPGVIVGSPRLVRLAVSNLVHNAVRHAYTGGPGEILLRVDADGIIVTDDGPGISAPVLAEMNRDVPLGRSPGGLGLVLAGWVAESHGGSLKMANRPHGGFEVRMALPVQAQPISEERMADVEEGELR